MREEVPVPVRIEKDVRAARGKQRTARTIIKPVSAVRTQRDRETERQRERDRDRDRERDTEREKLQLSVLSLETCLVILPHNQGLSYLKPYHFFLGDLRTKKIKRPYHTSSTVRPKIVLNCKGYCIIIPISEII